MNNTPGHSDHFDLPRLRFPTGWLVAILILGVIFTAGPFLTVYDQLPDPFPTHFDATGQADSWTAKTPTAFLGLTGVVHGIIFFVMVFVGALVVGLGSSALKKGAGNPVLGGDRYRSVADEGADDEPHPAHGIPSKVVRTWAMNTAVLPGVGVLCLVIQLAVGGGFWWEYHSIAVQHESPSFAFLLIMLGVCGALVLMFLTMHRRYRQALREYPISAAEARRWRYLVVYDDPDDPRLWIDTGTGTNFTVNVGRTAGKVMAVGFALVMIVIMLAVPAIGLLAG